MSTCDFCDVEKTEEEMLLTCDFCGKKSCTIHGDIHYLQTDINRVFCNDCDDVYHKYQTIIKEVTVKYKFDIGQLERRMIEEAKIKGQG